jgi:hypothetical protein
MNAAAAIATCHERDVNCTEWALVRNELKRIPRPKNSSSAASVFGKKPASGARTVP